MIVRIAAITLASLLLFQLFQERAFGFSYSDNRGLMPIGELEAFMANTGIAMSGSTGSVIYNPAGLAGAPRGKLSLSANAYMKWQASMNPIQVIDGTDFNFSTGSLQAVPHTFVSTMYTEPWTFGFSIMIPHQIKLEDSVFYSSPSYPVLQLLRTNYFQVMMAGVTAATKYGDHYDVGAGCFYTIYQTAQMIGFSGTSDVGASNALALMSFFRAEVNRVLCNLGIQKQIQENLRFGLTAMMPFMPLSKTATASSFIQNPNTGMSLGRGPKSVDTDYRIPLDIGFGIEYRLSPAMLAYADLSYQQGDRYSTGDFDTPDIDNKAVARYSGGLKWLAVKDMQAYAGLAYHPSAVKENEVNYAENYLKGSVGVNWLSGKSNVGVGLLYARSVGTKKSPVYNASLEQIGTKDATVRTEAMGILFSSGYEF